MKHAGWKRCASVAVAIVALSIVWLAWPARAERVVEVWRTSGYGWPVCLSVSARDGSCWFFEDGEQRVVRVSAKGKEVASKDGLRFPSSISTNSTDGSCWLADAPAQYQIVHLSAQAKILWRGGGWGGPTAVSVNPRDSSCWVADEVGDQIIHRSAGGEVLWRGGSPGTASTKPQPVPGAAARDQPSGQWRSKVLMGNALASKSPTSSDAGKFRSQVVFLQHDQVALASKSSSSAVASSCGCQNGPGRARGCLLPNQHPARPQQLTPSMDPAILWAGSVDPYMSRGTIKSKSPRRLAGRRCGDMTSSSLRGNDDFHSLRSLPRASSGHSANGLRGPDARSAGSSPPCACRR